MGRKGLIQIIPQAFQLGYKEQRQRTVTMLKHIAIKDFAIVDALDAESLATGRPINVKCVASLL